MTADDIAMAVHSNAVLPVVIVTDETQVYSTLVQATIVVTHYESLLCVHVHANRHTTQTHKHTAESEYPSYLFSIH